MKKVTVKCKNSNIGSNCYSISDGEKYIIIDPSIGFDEMDLISEGKIVGVLLTHGHFDHFFELNSYLTNTNINIYCHSNCLEKISCSVKNCSKMFGYDYCMDINERFKTIKNGDNIEILNEIINVEETFGHTNCSLTFTIDDFMFTGDFLFNGSVGRTDLYTGNNGMMLQSLNKLKNVTKNYYIYPGHGKTTNLYNELMSNIYLK